jgi:adenylate kinase family enzyme
VKLVVREINEIARRNEEENKGIAGWVLEGFPETVAQAQLLEKALTGYKKEKTKKKTHKCKIKEKLKKKKTES